MSAGASGRWHVHDYPTALSRWNYHPEFEIHLIRHSSGRFIIEDTIGRFEPGHLVLVGPHLPHHWISDVEPGTRLHERDVVFQFHPDWIRDGQAALPELARTQPLLARATRGIEFTGDVAECAARDLHAIGETDGLRRLGHVISLLAGR